MAERSLIEQLGHSIQRRNYLNGTVRMPAQTFHVEQAISKDLDVWKEIRLGEIKNVKHGIC